MSGLAAGWAVPSSLKPTSEAGAGTVDADPPNDSSRPSPLTICTKISRSPAALSSRTKATP